jgi:hypothetical protein
VRFFVNCGLSFILIGNIAIFLLDVRLSVRYKILLLTKTINDDFYTNFFRFILQSSMETKTPPISNDSMKKEQLFQAFYSFYYFFIHSISVL